ncbi:hypothetical protein [Lysinibacillus boronitolerans]|uniref:Uncharacterized protein n=1 Tax=Lysinibacillus boronitolerans JCM 21713 = 10a = NBRC 103108 TaxID=1294264 RepID=A0ABR4Y3A4_9BACI|nr:hypothetical protein [Lysinibacillus boronitolerans]KGR88255.1 hypothetical protein CD31_04390 [Lysinibacillus boronitolerans JCM 21713 = 10a = NBRC 103108]
MIKKKIFSKKITIMLVAGLFFCFLTLLRFIWMDFTNTAKGVAATQGAIDLRGLDTNHDFKIKLQKEWELYPNLLLASEGVKPYTQDKIPLQYKKTGNVLTSHHLFSHYNSIIFINMIPKIMPFYYKFYNHYTYSPKKGIKKS